MKVDKPFYNLHEVREERTISYWAGVASATIFWLLIGVGYGVYKYATSTQVCFFG